MPSGPFGDNPPVAKERDFAAIARKIVDKNLYIAVATADQSGQPWASPVFYAHTGYRQFFWVSEPDATHSPSTSRTCQASVASLLTLPDAASSLRRSPVR